MMSSPPSPKMLQQQQQQQNNIPARQVHNHSCSSPSYPSPSMSAYAYPPPNGQNSEQQYQGSPTSSQQSLPSGVNLPPLRAMDGRPQAQQTGQTSEGMASQAPPPLHSTGAMGSPLPPPITPMPPQSYYPNIPPPGHGMDPNQPMRFPLAPDARMISGGRHKKEIKRRTKTGCLTCRKRRIKCDEAHPVCRNCTKSKRECLGYDPIFKAQPGPAAIQPAPSSAPSMQGTSATSSPYPAPPPGYMPTVHQPYGPTVTAESRSPGSGTEPFDYSAAIDPALEGAGTAQSHGQRYPFEPSSDIQPGATKPVNITDILAVSGFPPPTSTSIPPITSNQYQQIRELYKTIYATGIDKMLETRWFTTRCIHHLVLNYRLCEQFTIMMSRFSLDPNADFHARAVTQSLEATVVWEIMNLARTVASKINSDKPEDKIGIEDDVNEGVEGAAARLTVLEKLITNHYLEDQPPLAAPESQGPKLDDQLRFREEQFWHLISTFLTLKDDEATSAKGIDDTLLQCRSFLDSRENRDVLYSVAVARHVGARMLEAANTNSNGTKTEDTEMGNGESEVKMEKAPSNGVLTAKTEIDTEEKKKLAIAKNFIEEEAKGKGTTQVVQRVCGMILRAWGGTGLKAG